MRWEEVDGDERKRFCNQCSLHVHNLSAMRQEEAQSFLEERTSSGERLCVTFEKRADGSLVSAPTATPASPFQAGSRMLAAAASLLFALFPFLAACRPSEGPRDDTTTAIDAGTGGTDTDCGGVEFLGEMVMPVCDTVEEPEDSERIVGRVANPEALRELGKVRAE